MQKNGAVHKVNAQVENDAQAAQFLFADLKKETQNTLSNTKQFH